MIRNAIQRFMYGRYGTDQLNLALLGLYLVLYLVSALTRWGVLYWLSLAVLFLLLFRTLSRNAARRRAEKRKVSPGGWPHDPVVALSTHGTQRQGTPLLQMPQLRPTAAGPPGQGKNHRHLPQLRRQL